MDAITEIETGLDARGHTVLRRCHCEAPLLVRIVDEPGPALALVIVNGAAGPLGGDHLRFRLDVARGAHVVVRSVAAAMAQPGPRGGRSTLEVDLVVGDGGTIDWCPEPTVSVIESDHHTTMHLAAARSSTVRVRECVSLGRAGERSGTLATRQRVAIDGASVLDHETVFAPGALLGPGAHGRHRMFVSEIHIGAALPAATAEVSDDCTLATFHVSPICAVTMMAIGSPAAST